MPDIPLRSNPFDLTFSPISDQVYVGLLTGEIKGFSYDQEGAHSELFSIRPSKQSCRGVAIDEDGRRLFCVSKDKSIRTIDPSRGQIIQEKPAAHESAINRVVVCTPNLVATGDDDGVVKLWDPRKPTEIRTYSAHIDYISDLLFTESKHQIVSASGDCTLTVMDVRSSAKAESIAQSQDQDDEFLSLCSIKDNTKLVVGTQLGMLSVFNRSSASSYVRPVDRVPGHPASVDALVALTDDVIATGSSDGLIRLVQFMPNKLLGAVADHGDFPVERLALSRDGKWLASASHDEVLKLTDIADALEESDEEGEEAEVDSDVEMPQAGEEDEDEEPAVTPARGQKRQAPSTDDGEDDSDGFDWEDDDDDDMLPLKPTSEDQREKTKPRPTKNKKQRGNQPTGGGAAFFADL